MGRTFAGPVTALQGCLATLPEGGICSAQGYLEWVGRGVIITLKIHPSAWYT